MGRDMRWWWLAWVDLSGRFWWRVLQGVDRVMLVAREYLLPTDRVLFIDDFVSRGNTAAAFGSIAASIGATMVGFLFLIEKAFERGRGRCRQQLCPWRVPAPPHGVPVSEPSRCSHRDKHCSDGL